jgi:hypothetical protein
MARKKTVVVRKPLKIKKTRKITEEHKENLRKRLVLMRAKKKPAEYKNLHRDVAALPDDDNYSFKNVKEWIAESKIQVSAFTATAKNRSATSQERQKAVNAAANKKSYIRMCEHYLKNGDWISMFSGKNENCKTTPRVVAMAYHQDGTPKRTVGFWYPDVEAVWTKEMDELDWLGEDGTFGSGNVMRKAYQSKLHALTDKQFDSGI